MHRIATIFEKYIKKQGERHRSIISTNRNFSVASVIRTNNGWSTKQAHAKPKVCNSLNSLQAS